MQSRMTIHEQAPIGQDIWIGWFTSPQIDATPGAVFIALAHNSLAIYRYLEPTNFKYEKIKKK